MNRKYSENFYVSIFALWFSTEILFSTNVQTIVGISISKISNSVSWLVFILLMAQIVLFQTYKKSELAVIIGITLPIIATTLLSGNRLLLSTWMFIVAAKNVSLDKIIYIAYKILSIMIPLVIFMRIFGFIEERILMRGSFRRFSLGFAHPNQLGQRVFQLVLCNGYINRDNLGVSNYFYIFLAVIFTIIVPNSKTTYISLIVFFLLVFLYKYVEKQKPVYFKLYANVLLIGAALLNALSIIFSFIDVNKYVVLSKVDKWMSGRFSWGHIVWKIYGASLLGQKIYISEDEVRLIGHTGRLYLDNAYLSFLLIYGVFVFLGASFFYLLLIRKTIVQKRYFLVTILFLYALNGMMESGLYRMTHNVFLLAFADLLYQKTDDKKLEV